MAGDGVNVRGPEDVGVPTGSLDHRGKVFHLAFVGVRRRARTALATVPTVIRDHPEVPRESGCEAP